MTEQKADYAAPDALQAARDLVQLEKRQREEKAREDLVQVINAWAVRHGVVLMLKNRAVERDGVWGLMPFHEVRAQ